MQNWGTHPGSENTTPSAGTGKKIDDMVDTRDAGNSDSILKPSAKEKADAESLYPYVWAKGSDDGGSWNDLEQYDIWSENPHIHPPGPTQINEGTRSFHPFPRLPLELRREIWKLALPGPRYIEVKRHPYFRFVYPVCIQSAPALFFACRESKQEVLRSYEPLTPERSYVEDSEYDHGTVWADLRDDIFCFEQVKSLSGITMPPWARANNICHVLIDGRYSLVTREMLHLCSWTHNIRTQLPTLTSARFLFGGRRNFGSGDAPVAQFCILDTPGVGRGYEVRLEDECLSPAHRAGFSFLVVEGERLMGEVRGEMARRKVFVIFQKLVCDTLGLDQQKLEED